MSPLSWPVLVGTLVVGSTALYAARVTGTLSPDVALVRLLICLAGVWLACTVVASLAQGAVAANQRAAETDLTETAELPIVVPEDSDAA